jgi:hypothetical protein
MDSSTRGQLANQRPNFSKHLILKQLGLAISSPFGILTLILLIASKKDVLPLLGLGLISIAFILSYRSSWLCTEAGTRPNLSGQQGALCRTQPGQAKKNLAVMP